MSMETEIGVISDFFAKPVVAGITLNQGLKAGDRIHIKGHTTDLTLLVESLQIDRVNVPEAKAGDEIGIKVPGRCRKGDAVFKVTG
jgi:putative protease